MMQLKRIYLPKPNKNNEYVSYEKQLQPRYVFDTEERRDFFHEREEEIMGIVVKEITEYVNCEDLCNDDENMFPKPKFMTGEWYLSEVNFEEDSFLSIQVAFLGQIWDILTIIWVWMWCLSMMRKTTSLYWMESTAQVSDSVSGISERIGLFPSSKGVEFTLRHHE